MEYEPFQELARVHTQDKKLMAVYKWTARSGEYKETG